MQQMPLGTSNHLAKLVSCYCRWLAPVVLPLLHLLELELLLGSFDSHSGWSGGVRFSFFSCSTFVFHQALQQFVSQYGPFFKCRPLSLR